MVVCDNAEVSDYINPQPPSVTTGVASYSSKKYSALLSKSKDEAVKYKYKYINSMIGWWSCGIKWNKHYFSIFIVFLLFSEW